MVRKIDLMHREFGITESHTCGECCNMERYRYRSRIYKKCRVYGCTNSEASDWALGWGACGMFGKEYNGTEIIKMISQKKAKTEMPVDGQIGLF